MILGPDHKKMSKSKGNVIDPDKVIEEFGADTLRMYEMFMGPIDADKPWNTRSMVGVNRFLKRVWKLCNDQFSIFNFQSNHNESIFNNELQRKLHQTIKKVGQDVPVLKFNTAIAAMMEFVNVWEATCNSKVTSENQLGRENLEKFILLLAPFAPFMAEELWQSLSNNSQVTSNKNFVSVHQQPWPKFDPQLLVEDVVEIPVQVNGKVRDTIEMPSAEAKDETKVVALALESENVRRHIGDKKVIKQIFIPGRMVNLVVSA
jgi:leucyl-tRNA synthetase